MSSTRNALVGTAAVVALAAPLVMSWEGLRLDPYTDIAGVRTYCWGETADVQERRYTKAECDALLTKSITKHAEPILACLPPATPLPTKAAFVSFGYNVGVKAACGSEAARRLRAGDTRGACAALMNWVYVNKVRIQGLANRRAAERRLCEQGLT